MMGVETDDAPLLDTSLERKPARDPLIGRVLQGRYDIKELVARGGMGKIYKAEQVPLGRSVAVKVLDLGYSQDFDPEFRKRFFLEAATSARLAHPNTVRIFDYGHEGDVFFIAMEFIEGRTLLKIIRDEAPMPALRVIHIARQMCSSLAEAHALGVIHRDLKPSNVLITRHGDLVDYVKVLDFGLVKLVKEDEEMTKSGLFLGSPNYMSPEQIRGKNVDQRTDVYALGVIVYRALTGTVPFRRDTSMSTLIAQLEEAPPTFATAAPGLPIPQHLEALTMRCLDKDPDGRFAGVVELERALAEAAELIRRGPAPAEPSLVPGRSRPVDRNAATAEMPAAETPVTAPTEKTTAPTKKNRRRRNQRPAGLWDRVLGSRRLPLAVAAAVSMLVGVFALTLALRDVPSDPVAPEVTSVRTAVTSTPEGAVVLRDQEFLGTTPLELEIPEDVQWTVTLQKVGYMPEAILLGAGEVQRVELLPLEPTTPPAVELPPEPPREPARSAPTTRPSRVPRTDRAREVRRRAPVRAAEITPQPTPEPTPEPTPAPRRRDSDLRDPWAD